MTDTSPIPFNRPALAGNEMTYLRTAVESGRISAGGPFTEQASTLLKAETRAAEVLLTTSCTDALELSALMLNLQPGDTIIVPSFTFVSTALAFVRAGARILFADIEPVTLGIDPSHVAELMDESVRAVVAVHYAGVACDLEGLRAVLSKWDGVALIEDNAHGLFGKYQGAPLGSFGRFATLSFHETKNVTCGEGGALLINDPADTERASTLYDKGTNRRSFMLGHVDKYSWQDVGSSFGLSDALAAILLGQLEQRELIMRRRQEVFDRYAVLLEPHAGRFGFSLPVVPPDRRQAYHMFYALLPDRTARDRVLGDLRSRGLGATFHYVPLHSSPGGRRFAARETECPVSEDISGRLLRLPFHILLIPEDIERTTAALIAAFE